jgi:MoaA/NifB/PqqE/SkfB family radical SAM enzyme
MMRVITLGLTCNNACVFCAQGDLSISERGPRDAALLMAAIAEVRPDEVVALQGGEPTLREDLPELLRALDSRGVRRIILQSNGRRLAYRTYARALREATGRLSLDVSLHGSTEPMHDYHTQVEGSFRQTLHGLRNARAEGIEACVTTVVTRSNYRHLAEIVKVAEQLGASAIRLSPALPIGRAAGAADRICAPAELVKPYLARALAEARRARLGFVVADQASSPEVAMRFAGLGEVEAERPRKARLPLVDEPHSAPSREALHALAG